MDCKQLEENIDKFISLFIKDDESINDTSCEYLRHVLNLYHQFKDLALDIRSISYNAERASTFSTRVEKYFQLFKRYSRGTCTSGKPYLHILRDHIPKFIEFWGENLDWGYGYFNCNAGEHLNKRIKCMEFGVTNLGMDRFLCIIRHMRVKQFYHPDQILYQSKEIRCQACNEIGHNRKNKNCPLHPDHVDIYFSDSDEDY